MTVARLIELLEDCPADAQVVVPARDHSFRKITTLEETDDDGLPVVVLT